MARAEELIALGFLDDQLGDDDQLLGAAVNARRGLMRRAQAVKARRASPFASPAARNLAAMRSTIVPAVPGVPPIGGREEPLGLGTFTFGNATAQTTALTGRPQKPFKGSRLVITIVRTAGAAAIGVNVNSLFVGVNNMLVSSQAVPADMFSPLAVGVAMNIDPATPGIDVVLNLATTATPGAGETITVTAAIIGLTFS
jgi:hypothetical protein